MANLERAGYSTNKKTPNLPQISPFNTEPDHFIT